MNRCPVDVTVSCLLYLWKRLKLINRQVSRELRDKLCYATLLFSVCLGWVLYLFFFVFLTIILNQKYLSSTIHTAVLWKFKTSKKSKKKKNMHSLTKFYKLNICKIHKKCAVFYFFANRWNRWLEIKTKHKFTE